MTFSKKRLAVVIAAAGLAIAGGSAYTASASVTDGNGNVGQYGTVTVNGAEVTSITYTTVNDDPPYVTAVTFVTDSAANATDTGYLGFNGTGETAFVVTETGDSAGLGDTLLSCGTGVAGDAITTFTCDLPEGDDIPVSVITSTDLAVEDGSF